MTKQLWDYLNSIDCSHYRVNAPRVIRSMDISGFLKKRYEW